MQIPLRISANGCALTAMEEDQIRSEAARLEQYFDRLLGCRVAVSVPHRWKAGGPVAYVFRIILNVPGEDIIVTRQAKPNFRAALEDAFAAARRRLQDRVREVRGDVKAHQEGGHGRVTRLLSYEGYGFITTDEGREIYFHRNSVSDGLFPRLEVGTEVRFVEVAGEKGPQASTVIPIREPAPAAPEP
jgi:cold shock CspA family protein